MKKKISPKFKHWSLFTLSVVGISAISAITLTSCGVSKTITNNMVDKWAGKGNFTSTFADGTGGLSFDDAVKQAATNKSGSTAFKNAVANEIAYRFYDNIANHNTYGNIDRQQFKDNWDKWTKQINDDYKDKIKDYKSNHKYDWPYYFQNEVLDPVGGTEANWKKYDSSKGMCQYIVKDLIEQAKKGSYLGIPSNIGATYTYNYNDPVQGNAGFSDDGSHPFLQSGQQLDPLKWNFINFYKNVYRPTTEKTLDEFYVALQREAFYEWLDRYQPLSTSNTLWKYSAPSTGGRDLKSIYNTTETTPSYALPYFDDATPTETKTTNQIFGDMYDSAFSDDAKGYFLWNTSGGSYNATTGKLSLINVDTQYNDSKASTMSLMSIDKYSSFSEFNGPAIYSLWDAYTKSSGTGTTTLDNMAMKKAFTAGDPARILSNFLSSTAVTSSYQKLSDWYSFWLDNSGSPSTVCKIYNYTAPDNEIKNFDYTINSFQLKNAASASLPYIMYRGDDGVHLVGLDGTGYIDQPNNNTAMFPSSWTTQFVTGNTQYSRTRENALLKFRALYEKVANNPIAGAGLKIEDAYKSYLDSNFSDILINTYYRTTHLNGNYWFGNQNDPDDQINWAGDTPITPGNAGIPLDGFSNDTEISAIYNYVKSVNSLFDFQDLVSKYDDANKKLFSFNKKYNDNLLYETGSGANQLGDSLKNGLALPLPWQPISGTIAISGTNEKEKTENLQTHYKENTHLLDPIQDTSSLSTLVSDVKTAFDSWKATVNDVVFDNSKKDYRKYSEHITVVNHYAADMLWAGLTDSNKISNILRSQIYENYLNKTGDIFDVEKTNANGGFMEQITSQYISSKLMTDDSSLPSYVNKGSAADNKLTVVDYQNILNSRWNSKILKDQSWIDHTSSAYVDYLKFLSVLQYLSDNNCANFMTYLQDKIPNDPQRMLDSPSIIAWMDKDKFSDQSTTSDYGFKNNYNNQFNNRYNNTNSDAGQYTQNQKSYGSYNQYWQYAPFIKNNGDTEKVGMGFLGLQTKNNLNGLPDDAAKSIFDNYSTAAAAVSSVQDFHGSLYRFGKTVDEVKNNIEIITTIPNINSLSTFFDSSLPGGLTAILPDTTTENWQQCKNLMQTQINQTNKLSELKKFLFGADDGTKGIFDSSNASALTILNNLIIPYNKSNSSTGLTNSYFLEPFNTPGNRVFGDSNIGTKVGVMQLNHLDVRDTTIGGVTTPAWDNLKSAVGEKVAESLLVQTAMTTTFDNPVTKAILDKAFGSGKKLDVYDRRFNDDSDLKSWLENYKTPN